MVLSARTVTRHACNIVVDRCRDTVIENVTMYKSYGMGILAEKATNVTVNKMTVKAREDDYFSLNADATHFVNCRGLEEKPTIISTNLTPDELKDTYSDRIASRILSAYTILQFDGADIRQLKTI